MPANISFVLEGVTLPSFFKKKAIKLWLEQAVSTHNANIVDLTFIFCDNEYILQVNRDHLAHDYYTDIITFPYQQGKKLEADIFISTAMVAENATEYNVSFQNELLRVMAHGVLHLLGFDDKTEEKSLVMRSMENQWIQNYIG